jgi:hypothetical protein
MPKSHTALAGENDQNYHPGNGYVTAMAVGQRQRLYSGVRMFTGVYLSSTPRALRILGVKLELNSLNMTDPGQKQTTRYMKKQAPGLKCRNGSWADGWSEGAN